MVLASIDSKTGKTELVAMSWVDRNRRFFITTTCGIGEGETIMRKRLRQLNKSGRAQPDKIIIDVDVPKAIKMYYEGAGTIDHHNRIRAAKLRMDRNLATKHWDKRFNLGVLGIVCVNAYLFSNRSSMRTTRGPAALSSLAVSQTSSLTTLRELRHARCSRESSCGGRSRGGAAYDEVDDSGKEKEGGGQRGPRSRQVRTQELQGIYVPRVQQMRACHRHGAEAVLVLQPHDKRGEPVLR